MTKREFLNQLSYHLTQLNNEERKEIMSFYEDRFNNAIYEGKTEEDVIAELETPEQIAKNVLLEYGIEKRVKDKRVDPASVMGLIFFDLFVSSWLIPVLFTISGSLVISWFSYFTVFGTFFKYGFGTGLATFIITTGGFALFLVFIIYFIALSVKLILSIFSWHVRVFSGDHSAPLALKVDTFNAFDYLRQIKITHAVLGTIALAGLVVSVGGGAIWRATSKPVEQIEGVLEVYEFDVADLDNYTLEVDLMNAAVDIEYGTTDQIVIRHQNNSEADVVYTELTNGLKVVDHSQYNFWENVTGLDFFIQFMNKELAYEADTMVIYIPEGMTFAELSILTVNGALDIEGMNATIIDLETANGIIDLTEVTADSIKVTSVNGEIHLDDVFGSSVYIEGVNGEIAITDVNTATNDGEKLDITLVNGEIIITDAYFRVVNVDNVNGDIDYRNSDHNYVADSINLNTVNGSESSNVAH